MKREPGYYWVKLTPKGNWFIAEWINIDPGKGAYKGGVFFTNGSEAEWLEEAFAVIHPQKLIAPDEQKG